MILRSEYVITDKLYEEALRYADLSKAYTSDRHDFHAGGLDEKKRKMFEGKLGEKALKMFFLENMVPFEEDPSSYDERDEYDFLICFHGQKLKIDVKTRTEHYHTRTLEMVEQARTHPKDIYVSVRLFRERNAVRLLGWFTKEDMFRVNRIENNGYLDNYVMYDNDLRPISELYDLYLSKIIS